MKIILLAFIVFLSSCSRHSPAPVTDARTKNKQKKVRLAKTVSTRNNRAKDYIQIKKGDTLYSIGFSENMDYKYLAQINGISAPYRIYPGQQLRLKADKSTTNKTTKTYPLKVNKPFSTSTPTAKPIKKPYKQNSTINSNTRIVNKPNSKTPTTNKTITNKAITKKIPKTNKKPVVSTVTPIVNSSWRWPLKGKIISTFSTSDTSKKGIDIASSIGQSVYASNNGTIVYSGDGLLGYGELIIIKHSNNLLSAYAHNSSRLVTEGTTVKQGQEIAKSGKGSDGVGLLHFEIRKNGQPVNPLKYLPKR